jgi:putative ABC transport system substrate-binding protein
VSAQSGRRERRIAIVHLSKTDAAASETGSPTWRAFFAELRQRGYAEGENLLVDRQAVEDTQSDSMPSNLVEVVARQPELIVVTSGLWTRRVRLLTTTIPVITLTSNPIDEGLTSNLARPSGNISGLATDAGPALLGKRLDLLLEAVPDCSHVACLGASATYRGMRDLWRDAKSRGVTVQEFLVHWQFASGPQEARYPAAFNAILRDGANAVLVFGDAEHLFHASTIAELALRHRLPLISPFRQLTEAGGLMSYGADWKDLEQRRAAYVARILDGARIEDLPFEQPTQFEFLVNLRTAEALGRSLPTSLLARADEVIQ